MNKHFIAILISIIAINTTIAQTIDIGFDHKKPETFANALRMAAKWNDWDVIANIGDPCKEYDSDVATLCNMSSFIEDMVELEKKSFLSNEEKELLTLYSKTRKDLENLFFQCVTVGEPVYETFEETEFAKVNISVGLGDEKELETIVLVNRYGNWYLYSF